MKNKAIIKLITGLLGGLFGFFLITLISKEFNLTYLFVCLITGEILTLLW